MSTLRDDITQEASKGLRILWSDPFLSKSHELPVNKFNWIFIEINGSRSWPNRLYLKFCFYFLWLFSLILPFHVACSWSHDKMNGRKTLPRNRENDSPHHPSHNGENIANDRWPPISNSALFRLFKSPFSWGATVQPGGLRAETPWAHRLCSNSYLPCICFFIPGWFPNSSLCLSFPMCTMELYRKIAWLRTWNLIIAL